MEQEYVSLGRLLYNFRGTGEYFYSKATLTGILSVKIKKNIVLRTAFSLK